MKKGNFNVLKWGSMIYILDFDGFGGRYLKVPVPEIGGPEAMQCPLQPAFYKDMGHRTNIMMWGFP